MSSNNYVIGIDFGTDSVRSVIINADTGDELAASVTYYRRWQDRLLCDPSINQYRQHPLDYVEGLTESIREALSQCTGEIPAKIKGISIDTTGSTIVAVDRTCTPLGLLREFKNNPNAMFILWKDHTAVKEADEINVAAKKWAGADYTRYAGGVYSSEWFWSKILHVLKKDPKVGESAFSWVEHCDWIPALLTGCTDPLQIKRSRCAGGHKALWHESFQGLPPDDFLTGINPLLAGITRRLYTTTHTADKPAGTLCKAWAEKLGLTTDVVVGVGAFDAHMGAVGGEIEPYVLSKVIGTSTCDIAVIPKENFGDRIVSGICGQVDGSVIPGMVGLEAGQSAFGDIFDWYKKIILTPCLPIMQNSGVLAPEQKEMLIRELDEAILPQLTAQAEKLPLGINAEIAVDWMNGRRTPDANQLLKGAVAGLSLGSGSDRIFRSLVEAAAFGARKILDRFISEGVRIEGVIALGGVAKKSPFIMQTLADILGKPIKIARSEQAVALGAAMFAAVASGIHPDINKAKKKMGAGFEKEYTPHIDNMKIYNRLYDRYQRLGNFLEDNQEN